MTKANRWEKWAEDVNKARAGTVQDRSRNKETEQEQDHRKMMHDVGKELLT